MQTTHATLTPKTKSTAFTQPFKKQNSTLNKNSPSPFFAQTQTQKLKTVEQKQKPYHYLPPFIEKSIQQGAPQNLSNTASAQVSNTQATQTKESWWAKNHVSERIVGGLKLAAGTAEASAGAALGVASSWTGIGALVGGAVFVHGSDVAASGLRQIYSGKQEYSLTSLGLQKAGVSEALAENMDASLSLVGSLGASAIQNKIAQKTFTQTGSQIARTNNTKIEIVSSEKILSENSNPVSLESLNLAQKNNFKRFVDKLPQKAQAPQIIKLADGKIKFTSTVPANNIPGSKAVYEKTIDTQGQTISYIKNTFKPDGALLHSKRKFP